MSMDLGLSWKGVQDMYISGIWEYKKNWRGNKTMKCIFLLSKFLSFQSLTQLFCCTFLYRLGEDIPEPEASWSQMVMWCLLSLLHIEPIVWTTRQYVLPSKVFSWKTKLHSNTREVISDTLGDFKLRIQNYEVKTFDFKGCNFFSSTMCGLACSTLGSTV